MALLEARGLAKQFGRRVVVDDVDLDVDAGEIVGLLGPNGAGKTTTFRMVVGMIAPKAGRVWFSGHDVTRLAMYKRARLGLGYLAQDSSVFRKLSVEQNLYAILELMTTRRGQPYRSSRAERKKRVGALLERFGLTALARSPAATLSGGERRRLEIARCLASEPMLIMLDEPFTGIDPKTVGDIQEIICELCRGGIGVLITDHHVAETLRITNRSYLIAGGRMLAHGTPREIVDDPRVREAYLGEQFIAAAIGEPAMQAPSLAPPHQPSVRSFLESQDVQELVSALGTAGHGDASARLKQWGERAIVPLLVALERRDPLVRQRAHQVLCEILGASVPYDPQADEPTRLRQIGIIRSAYERRRAG